MTQVLEKIEATELTLANLPKEEPRTFYEMYLRAEKLNPNVKSFLRRRGDGVIYGYTFPELRRMVEEIAAGFREIGLEKGDRVLFLCDNSNHWMVVNTGIITSGGICVPRATDVTDEDIKYIANHAEVKFAIVQNQKTYNKLMGLLNETPTLKRENIFILEDEKFFLLKNSPLSVYDNIIF